MRLVARAADLRPDTQLEPWRLTVARNLYASYRRSRQLEDSHADGLIGLWPSGLAHPSPFEVAAANETGRRIEAAIGALPVTCREALLLVVVEGLKPAEAATICGVSPEAMRQRLSRARAALALSLAAADAGKRPTNAILITT